MSSSSFCLHFLAAATTQFQMAQQCLQSEYFDNLLYVCKPCHLRCSKAPPATCQQFCNASMTSSAKSSNAVLWTCLGFFLIVSLAVFMLMILLKKMNSKPLKEEFKNTGSVLLDMADADLDSRPGDDAILPRSLGYTVEECTCEECTRNKAKADSDHIFPLPATEEGATALVTTKTDGDCRSLSPTPGVAVMEKQVSAR
ncbi:tumor necrosis factor receptor superfamily member 17 isoform X1 [Dipodomys spectabilis]|uniref:tumor necrosis factor receptor superfamily member 17 isoform X1 n=1 Tax=Dipodomys spectabilis TaxID=105255 RepID=UPI001C5376FA|nr:tumor necrosis factor receptor superfamily member 17 isoform X1 [Dipodomys spectabilis]